MANSNRGRIARYPVDLAEERPEISVSKLSKEVSSKMWIYTAHNI